jgi:VIT1/CCC1 family predicted Fe2+/Mn2+ transporter
MSRESILIILGVLVAIVPSAGLPQSWVSILIPLLGLGVVVVAYTARASHMRKKSAEEPMVRNIT